MALREHTVEGRLTCLLYRQAPPALGFNLLLSILLSFALCGRFSFSVVGAWLGLHGLILAIRAVVIRYYVKREPADAEHQRWRVIFGFGSTLTAASWATASVLFFDPTAPLQLSLLLATLGATAAGATASLCSSRGVTAAFLAVLLVPISIRLLLIGELVPAFIGVLAWIFSAFLLVTAFRFRVTLAESFRLRDENAEILEELRSAKEATEEASRSRSEFLATVSHELRTPLNGIIGMAEILRENPLDETQGAHLAILSESAELLLTLLNDILDLSKMEANRFELEYVPFRIEEVIRRSGDLGSALARRKRLDFQVHIDPDAAQCVSGDPLRLQQILLNLIGNAVKFTDRGHVCLYVRRPEPALWKFTIEDTGIGISPDVRDRLFQRFAQADPSMSRRYGGSGLGLAIAHDLTVLMNGRIDVESSDGNGARFHVFIPLRPAESEGA